jgi:uncharacterized HAD superfamily protein/adenine/guanine phosphoribosyltransferase-like PRPP-binding protein
MTYDPPNWQWCQSASEQDRLNYKKQCELKQERLKKEEDTYLAGQYITNAQLIRDCKNILLPQIANLDIRGILGIPRSGMFPASMIAMWLNLPLYFLDPQNNLVPMSGASKFGGIRMMEHKPLTGRLLVVDDTVYSGTAIKNFKSRFLEDVYFAATYVKPEAKDLVDFYAKELPPPHLLEWNLFNCTYIQQALLDFDGILCPNVPFEILEDEEKHKEWLSNVKPFYHRLPKFKCKGIVTARFERYRDITENWLARHNVKYERLVMMPNEMEEDRLRDHVETSSTYKAKHFVKSDAKFFIESEVPEAIRIRKKSGKLVICPEEKDG